MINSSSILLTSFHSSRPPETGVGGGGAAAPSLTGAASFFYLSGPRGGLAASCCLGFRFLVGLLIPSMCFEGHGFPTGSLLGTLSGQDSSGPNMTETLPCDLEPLNPKTQRPKHPEALVGSLSGTLNPSLFHALAASSCNLPAVAATPRARKASRTGFASLTGGSGFQRRLPTWRFKGSHKQRHTPPQSGLLYIYICKKKYIYICNIYIYI